MSEFLAVNGFWISIAMSFGMGLSFGLFVGAFALWRAGKKVGVFK